MERTFLFLLCLTSLIHGSQGTCVKKGPCSCQSPQGLIDLSPLASTQGPRFKDKADNKGNWLFSWNPCNPFTEGTCAGVAGCQLSPVNVVYYNIGTQDSATFSDDFKGNLVLSYTAITDATRTLNVTLVCNQSHEGHLTVIGEEEPGSRKYFMTLESKYSCFNSTSTSTSTSTSVYSTTTESSSQLDHEIVGLLAGILFILCAVLILLAFMFCLIYFLFRSATQKKHHSGVKVNSYGSDNNTQRLVP